MHKIEIISHIFANFPPFLYFFYPLPSFFLNSLPTPWVRPCIELPDNLSNNVPQLCRQKNPWQSIFQDNQQKSVVASLQNYCMAQYDRKMLDMLDTNCIVLGRGGGQDRPCDAKFSEKCPCSHINNTACFNKTNMSVW